MKDPCRQAFEKHMDEVEKHVVYSRDIYVQAEVDRKWRLWQAAWNASPGDVASRKAAEGMRERAARLVESIEIDPLALHTDSAQAVTHHIAHLIRHAEETQP